jgi:hypothetical protein
MIVSQRVAAIYLILLAALLLVAPTLRAESDPAPTPAPNIFAAPQHADRTRPVSPCMPANLDSPFIPVDSWVYPAVLRLYSLGFVDNVYLGMRPWTRSSVENMLDRRRAHRRCRLQPRSRPGRGDLRSTPARAERRHPGPMRHSSGQGPRRVHLHRRPRHLRHAPPRQLPPRLLRHQRLRPPHRRRLQQLHRRFRLRRRRPLPDLYPRRIPGHRLLRRLLPRPRRRPLRSGRPALHQSRHRHALQPGHHPPRPNRLRLPRPIP